MRYWYFVFEGNLVNETAFAKFYGSVLLPVMDGDDPQSVLKTALSEYDAVLIAIEDAFEFILDDYDENDPDNQGWFDWYQQVKQTNLPQFTPWQRFDE